MSVRREPNFGSKRRNLKIKRYFQKISRNAVHETLKTQTFDVKNKQFVNNPRPVD